MASKQGAVRSHLRGSIYYKYTCREGGGRVKAVHMHRANVKDTENCASDEVCK
jgi:hypothetical protein